MPETKVVNETGKIMDLKIGTLGVLRTLCKDLQHKKAIIIKVAPNATNTEYWCTERRNDKKRVVLSYNDCMQYRKFHIKLKVDGTYTWKAVKRRSLWDALRRRSCEVEMDAEDT